MPKSKNSESKSNKVLNASENNTKQVEKLSIELNNLSNEIESHGKKLQIRKEKYAKIAEENGQFVKKLKKPLKDLKENLENLEYLVDRFLGELTARNLSVSTCPDLLNLKADISSSLKYVDILESERI